MIGINLKSYENILCVTKGGHDCVKCRVSLVVATASEIVASYAEGGALHFLDLTVSPQKFEPGMLHEYDAAELMSELDVSPDISH
jgi:hypothetical protein